MKGLIMRKTLTAIALLVTAGPALADEPIGVPLTRPEMKQLLEESKKFEPRLKAPEAAEGGLSASSVRTLLPAELRGGYFMQGGRSSGNGLRNPNAAKRAEGKVRSTPRAEPDPNMTLDPAYKTMLFWIVSRSNNCVYCMGHQEVILVAAGVSEDRIAGLDGDWSEYTLAERAGFGLARKMTVAPHTITDADIAAVREHFTANQALEIITTVAGFNAMNRWTGPLRLTQEPFREFLTPTSPRYSSSITKVGPVPPGSSSPRCAPVGAPRPALEGRGAVEQKLAECRARKSRFALVEESAARALLPANAFPTDRPLPYWVRLLANFPRGGPAKIAGLLASQTKGNLPAKLKARLAWVSARADRAWYALAVARDRLRDSGESDDDIFAIDQGTEPDSRFTPAEQIAFAFARKLTVDPALIDDGDFNGLRKHYSEAEIAELIHHVNQDVFVNLVTEAAQLPLEQGGDRAVSQR
jgi:alkylhydroperoxidase family enzyme